MYIIEHQTRGTFREFDGDTPRWSWSGSRSDPDKAYQFTSLQRAQEALNKILPGESGRSRNLISIRDGSNGYKEVILKPETPKFPIAGMTMEEFAFYVKNEDTFSYEDVRRMVIRAFRLALTGVTNWSDNDLSDLEEHAEALILADQLDVLKD